MENLNLIIESIDSLYPEVEDKLTAFAEDVEVMFGDRPLLCEAIEQSVILADEAGEELSEEDLAEAAVVISGAAEMIEAQGKLLESLDEVEDEEVIIESIEATVDALFENVNSLESIEEAPEAELQMHLESIQILDEALEDGLNEESYALAESINEMIDVHASALAESAEEVDVISEAAEFFMSESAVNAFMLNHQLEILQDAVA